VEQRRSEERPGEGEQPQHGPLAAVGSRKHAAVLPELSRPAGGRGRGGRWPCSPPASPATSSAEGDALVPIHDEAARRGGGVSQHVPIQDKPVGAIALVYRIGTSLETPRGNRPELYRIGTATWRRRACAGVTWKSWPGK
jgi:hypothetical protein